MVSISLAWIACPFALLQAYAIRQCVTQLFDACFWPAAEPVLGEQIQGAVTVFGVASEATLWMPWRIAYGGFDAESIAPSEDTSGGTLVSVT